MRADPIGPALKTILKSKGGMLKDHNHGPLLRIYTGVTFGSFHIDVRTGISLQLFCDAPPGDPRRHSAAFWRESQLLNNGALVVMLWKTPGKDFYCHFGTISSNEVTPMDSAGKISISVNFKANDLMQKVLAFTSAKTQPDHGLCLLLEAPAMFAAYEPFLERLQTVTAARLPFADIIAGSSAVDFMAPPTQAPAYSSQPGFRVKIKPGAQATKPGIFGQEELHLVTSEEGSQAHIRNALLKTTTFDESQAHGMVHCLSRNVALLQGPPGTGKSFVGVQLIKALIDSGATPASEPLICLRCF
jgi:hypothetical protein